MVFPNLKTLQELKSGQGHIVSSLFQPVLEKLHEHNSADAVKIPGLFAKIRIQGVVCFGLSCTMGGGERCEWLLVDGYSTAPTQRSYQQENTNEKLPDFVCGGAFVLCLLFSQCWTRSGPCTHRAVVCTFPMTPDSVCLNGVVSTSIHIADELPTRNSIPRSGSCGIVWGLIAGVAILPTFQTCGSAASTDCW